VAEFRLRRFILPKSWVLDRLNPLPSVTWLVRLRGQRGSPTAV